MPQEYNTNFIRSDGSDMGKVLLTREYLLSVYPQIANQFVTPELWGWGYNYFSQLGDNTTIDKSTPITTFAGGSNWKQIGYGLGLHNLAIKNDGTLWVWGANNSGQINSGQLGINDGTGSGRTTPVTTFAGGNNWKQVSCGLYHSSAIKTDGTLWTWGLGTTGQLGDNTILNKSTPTTTFAGGNNWKQVSCGGLHTAAIKNDGTLWVWGGGGFAQIGDNESIDRRTPVTTFAGGNNWKQVAAGQRHTAAIKTDGTLWTWGYNFYGTIGDNTTIDKSTPTTTFAGGNNWKQVACGSYFISTIKTDGTLWSWGANDRGQLGNNVSTSRCLTPITTFSGGTNWKQVSCGSDHVAAIKTDGTLWTWGINTYGQIGNNTKLNGLTPVTTFIGGNNWKQASARSYHTTAIRSSEEL